MYYKIDWAIVVPMANEEADFSPFIDAVTMVLNRMASGRVYLIVDTVSRDHTLDLCQEQSSRDPRFTTIWAPENRNVVDAYQRGFLAAYEAGHEIIIEMDAGMSHDPRAIPMFIRVLNEGNECAFGSRFINGGSMSDSSLYRRLLSRVGTMLSNLLLGSRMCDMTSGFQGFHTAVVGKLLNYKLLSKAHFYQTEVRYLLRRHRFAEIPIHYKAPSPSVSRSAIANSLSVLLFYTVQRFKGNSRIIK